MAEMTRLELDDHVAAFLEANPKWVDINHDTGGMALCDHASEELEDFLRNRGVRARVQWMTLVELFPNELQPHEAYPMNHQVGEPGSEHCVVLIAGYVVDLTARQYSEELPFPFVWESPHA
jgi:hypothetical protein